MDLGGLPLMIMVTRADLSDRDIAKDLLFRLRLAYPAVSIVWADSAYSGELVAWAARFLHLTIKVVSRPAGRPGFLVLPRRWVVERSFSWLLRARRACRDHERLTVHSESHLVLAAITLLSRRLTQAPGHAGRRWA